MYIIVLCVFTDFSTNRSLYVIPIPESLYHVFLKDTWCNQQVEETTKTIR